MDKIISIIIANDATFYNYRTGQKRNYYGRISLFLILSFVSIFFLPGDISAFLGSLITVQAVLVGFAFSVMFFLLSTPPADLGEQEALEDQISNSKLKRLSKELFDNVSYFSLLGMSSLAISLLLLVPDAPHLIYYQAQIIFRHSSAQALWIADWASTIGRSALLLFMSFTVAESSYTFARTTGRVTFLFSERSRLSKI